MGLDLKDSLILAHINVYVGVIAEKLGKLDLGIHNVGIGHIANADSLGSEAEDYLLALEGIERSCIKHAVEVEGCAAYIHAAVGNGGADKVHRRLSYKSCYEYVGGLEDISAEIKETVEIDAKYSGYLVKGMEQIERAKKLEEKLLPDDIDYLKIEGLRLEARQKLDKIRPASLGQAGRISGVSPADIAVLMVYLKK